MVLVLVVTLTVFLLYRWQQKNQLGTDIDGMDMSPHQKLDPPPDRQSQSAPEDFQGLHLEPGRLQEEDLTLQPPYYDLGVSPIYRPLTGQSVFLPKDQHRVLPEVAAMKEEPESSCLKDSDIHYAELDTSVLELAPGPQTAVSGPGEAVEYATIPLSPPEH